MERMLRNIRRERCEAFARNQRTERKDIAERTALRRRRVAISGQRLLSDIAGGFLRPGEPAAASVAAAQLHSSGWVRGRVIGVVVVVVVVVPGRTRSDLLVESGRTGRVTCGQERMVNRKPQ